MSNTASGRMYRTSSPLACFQDVMQPPNSVTCGQKMAQVRAHGHGDAPAPVRARQAGEAILGECQWSARRGGGQQDGLPRLAPPRSRAGRTSAEAPQACLSTTVGSPPRPSFTSTKPGMPAAEIEWLAGRAKKNMDAGRKEGGGSAAACACRNLPPALPAPPAPRTKLLVQLLDRRRTRGCCCYYEGLLAHCMGPCRSWPPPLVPRAGLSARCRPADSVADGWG